MGWSANGIARPRRRRGDRRPAAPATGAGPRDAPPRDDPWDALGRELDRCRRYRHHLTLVRLVPDDSSARRSLAARARREGGPGRRRDTRAAAVAAVRAAVRTGDCVWVDGGAVFMLLLETDATGGREMVQRIQSTVGGVLEHAEARIASFPEHGLTVHALRAAVTRREKRARPGSAPVAELEWRIFTDRLHPTNGSAGPLPDAAE
jgi:hypothetical protein